jgi:NitT/TauT family transport system substrate-binding protein
LRKDHHAHPIHQIRRRRCLTLARRAVRFALPARAEGQLRIAQQFGVVYLLLNVAQDQKLIEKHGQKQGVPDQGRLRPAVGRERRQRCAAVRLHRRRRRRRRPAADHLGPHPRRQNVRGIASLGNFPYYLVSTNPNVKTIADFSDKDRIALPAVTVSVQARILQMAAAKQWGTAQYTRLDRLTQSVPHPDATAAVIAGQTELNSHFGNPPFQDQELAGNPKAHIVLNSYDVLGGPSSSTVLYATEKWVKENPKTYRAFVDALNEAAQLIAANPELAADAYLRVTKAKTDRAFLLKVIKESADPVQGGAAEHAGPGAVPAPGRRHQEAAGLAGATTSSSIRRWRRAAEGCA